jgi:hypothetical protein
MSKCPHCPLAEGRECRSYPALCQNMAADPTRWRPILDRVNGDVEPPAYPPLLEQAGNLLAAAGRFVASGCETVDQAEYDRRRAICRACPGGYYDADRDRCRACGCNMAVKTWGRVFTCEKGLW